MTTKQEQEKDNKILRLEKELERLKKNLKKQKYGLVWMDVPEAFEDDVENKLPILKENSKLAIKSKDNKPTHILIEGDNYHALTCLNYTHKGKVDVIYIDPPYNTGAGDFKYKDKRILEQFPDGTEVPKDHPYRHSYWLSFMRKRIELAKDILNSKGAIFISIDVNELAQLKLLCDEILGEKNLVTIISVKVKDPAGVGQQSVIFDVCEYVLVYAKDIDVFKNAVENLPMDFEELNNQYGAYNKIMVDFGKEKFVKEIERQNVGSIQIYKCEGAKIEKTTNLDFSEYIKNRKMIFTDYNPNGGTILAIKEHIPKIGLSYLEYTPTKGRDAGQKTKMYFYNGRIIAWLNNVVVYENKKLYKRTKMTNFWNMPNASLYLEGGVDFTNGKKPLKLVKKILEIMDNKDAVVLDFFAGSGTTGEAVVELNNNDDGTRQFILVTNNDEVVNGKKNRIMTDICYPRIKNAIHGYNNKPALGGSVKYYNTAFVGENNIIDATDKDKIELAHNAGELLAIAENTFELVKQDKYMQIFENADQYTAVYFKEEMDKLDDFVKDVKKLKKDVSVYIFSWEDEGMCDDFEGLNHIRIKTIPQPIIEIYKQIYNLI
jgi:adenine-specific DNA-methyltransferase